MEILKLIDNLKDWDGTIGKKVTGNKALKKYSGVTPDGLRGMVKSILVARRVEREEKLLLRKGYNRFFIGCGGKELIDVAFSETLRKDDPWVGYYRNKAFDIHRGSSLEWKMLEAIGDAKGPNKGQQIPAHPGYPELAIIPQASPTGGHALEAAGIAEAIKPSLARGKNRLRT